MSFRSQNFEVDSQPLTHFLSWKKVEQMDLWAIQHDSSDELLCWDMLFGTVPKISFPMISVPRISLLWLQTSKAKVIDSVGESMNRA